jgi:hypothetical protein
MITNSDGNFSVAMPKHRVTRAQKNADNKHWYKNNLDFLDKRSFSQVGFNGYGLDTFDTNGVSEYKRMKVNYDLFNNIINIRDFEYVTKPFGAQAGELPANFVNRDIISPKIKMLLGMEMKRPFSWKVFAVNEEATTRREQEEFSRMKDYVVSEIMKPIRMELEKKAMEEAQGQELTPEQQQQIQQKIEQELQAQTPEEVKKYMLRDHQDPAEALAHQLLEYLIQKEDIPTKFNQGFKHLCIAAKEAYWVGVLNNEPAMSVINPLYFDYDKSPDLEFIEDGEWAVCVYRMSPSRVVQYFGDELSNVEIDKIYSYYTQNMNHVVDANFTFNVNKEDEGWTVRVVHATWKALRKIGFLSYMDANGEVQETLVDEGYTLNREQGDISCKWEWIPEVYEGYKIGTDIYVYLRPVPGQFKDINNLYNCKLPYIGAVMDTTNSLPTSFIDRVKAYQYYYDIIMYRIELLMASDKGKLLMMNIGMIPESAGIDVEKWLYFAESSKIGFLNPNEEGNKGDYSIPNAVKEIDMSLASDIQKYINLAEYIERRAGISIGIPPEAEGQIGPNAAVTNTKQVMVQSSHILEPVFELHNHVKKAVLERLLDTAKVCYTENPNLKLNYILDDFSRRMLTIDADLLDNSSYGIFVSNSSKAHEVKELISQLAHAAMQSQRIDLSDVIKVIRAEGVQEAEEMLMDSEQRKREEMQQQQMQQLEKQQEMQQQALAHEKEMKMFDRETEMMKEKMKTDREIQSQTIMSLGFNEDKDVDKDGKLDILEVAKQGVDVDVKQRKQQLDEEKFRHQKEMDKKNAEIEIKKLNNKK